METLKDLLKDLKDRLSNPLISSFIVAWLLGNWRITIGLLFYRQDELILDDYVSYFDLVASNTAWNNPYTFLIPLLISLSYTFLFPYAKAYIKLKHAEVIAKNDTDILKATSSGRIPTSRFIELRDEHTTAMAKLTEITEAESATRLENQTLKASVAEQENITSKLRNENASLTQKVTEYTSTTDSNMLQGVWTVKAKALGHEIDMIWEIESNVLTESEGLHTRTFVIKDIIFDRISLKIGLYLENINDGKPNKVEAHLLVTNNDISQMTLARSTFFQSLSAVLKR